MNPCDGTFNNFLVMANVDGIVEMDSAKIEGDQQISIQQKQQKQQKEKEKELWPKLATLEMQYFKAVSLYRRRNYEKCVEVCNVMLETGNEQNVPIFSNVKQDWMSMDEVVDEVFKVNQSKDHHKILDFKLKNNLKIEIGQEPYYKALTSLKQINQLPTNSFFVNNNLATNRPTNNNWPRINSNKHCYSHAYNTTTTTSITNNNNITTTTTTNINKKEIQINEIEKEKKKKELRSKIGEKNSQQMTMPTWLMEAIWQLKMRALTQRVYIDDLETNEVNDDAFEEVELERIAITARPGTSIRTAFTPRPNTSTTRRIATAASLRVSGFGQTDKAPSTHRPLHTTSNTLSRPSSGMLRFGDNRPISASLSSCHTASRCGTASRIRSTSAAAFNVNDATSILFQASRLNPTIYADRQVLVKSLFQFLYYHEADVQKAYSLCEAVISARLTKKLSAHMQSIKTASYDDEWWWQQQLGRCFLAMRYPRKAEKHLLQSLNLYSHPDTYLLLSRLYQRMNELQRSLELIERAIEQHPFDVHFRLEQGRILDQLATINNANTILKENSSNTTTKMLNNNLNESVQIYRLVTKLNPINIEALACIALNYFYDNNPEMALMYYKRILSLGLQTAEVFCNIALCCLYGGQIDLVLPCFQRALKYATTNNQKADIWYNLSFVAIGVGDFHLAKRSLQLCLTYDGQYGAAFNNLAVLTALSGDVLKAKSYLNAAKEILNDTANEVYSNIEFMKKQFKL